MKSSQPQGVRHALRRLLRSERGQGMVEYALIVSVVALGSLGALHFLGGSISDLFNRAGSQLSADGIDGGGGGSVLPPDPTTVPIPGGGTGTAAQGDDVTNNGGPNDNAGYSGLDGIYTDNPPPGTDTGDPCSFTVAGQVFTGVWVRHNDIPGGNSDWTVTPPGNDFDWACLNVSTASPSGGSVVLAPDPVLVGAVMTATTSGWTNATYYEYSWRRNISATCASGTYGTYDTDGTSSLTETDTQSDQSDAGRCYEVRVNARNAFGSSGTDPLSNRIVMNLPPLASGGSVDLSPTGNQNVGQVLTGTANGWTGAAEYTFIFRRSSNADCGTPGTWTTVDTDGPQAGLTSTYTTDNGDSNRCFQVQLVAYNGAGQGAPTVTSSQTAFIQGPPTGGSQTITCSTSPCLDSSTLNAGASTGWAGSPSSFSYQWQSSNDDSNSCSTGGGSSVSYSDLGSATASPAALDPPVQSGDWCYRLEVTATNGIGSTTINSNAILVDPVPPPLSTGGSVSFNCSGTCDDEESISATTSGWTNGPILGYSWTWEQNTDPLATCASAIGTAGWTTVNTAGGTTSTTNPRSQQPNEISSGTDLFRVTVRATNAGGTSTVLAQACVVISDFP